MVEWFVVGASCWTLMWMLFVWLSYKKRKGVPLLLLHIYVILFWFRLFFYLRFPFVSQFVPFIFDHFSRFEPFIYSSTFLKVENDAICVLVHACMHFMNEWKQKKKLRVHFYVDLLSIAVAVTGLPTIWVCYVMRRAQTICVNMWCV